MVPVRALHYRCSGTDPEPPRVTAVLHHREILVIGNVQAHQTTIGDSKSLWLSEMAPCPYEKQSLDWEIDHESIVTQRDRIALCRSFLRASLRAIDTHSAAL
jgi:hypothetical protein